MVEQYAPAGWLFHAPQQHQWYAKKWYEALGFEITSCDGHHYDTETRVLTVGNIQTVTKTPPPWVGKITDVRKETL